MRLDLFLKKTALIKRRTIAKEIIELGKVTINGKTTKPSYDVKSGDILLLKLGIKTIEAKAIIEIIKNKENPSAEIINITKE
jgi:ribosomal 50S subunit-recycling heat shock protein